MSYTVPLQLFTKLAGTSGENALTEALAICLKGAPSFRRLFLQKANVSDDAEVIKTQQVDPEDRGRPDLQVISPSCFLLFEIKEHDKLTHKQWRRYLEILNGISRRQNLTRTKLRAIVAPWTSVEATIQRANSEGSIWYWSEIYGLAAKAIQVAPGANPVEEFLLKEFLLFLEDREMKPFDGFSTEDIDTVRKLPILNGRFQAFFFEVAHRVSQLTQGIAAITNKGVEIKTYKGYSGVYPGVEFIADVQGRMVKGWVGLSIENEQDQPRFSLWLWTDKMGQTPKDSKTHQLERTLQKADFKWDSDEQAYSRTLKATLEPQNEKANQPEILAKESGEILKTVFTRLGKG